MKVKIERIHYVLLRNSEFPTVYGQTVRICEKYPLENLFLGKSFGELSSFRSAIEGLTVYLRKNAKLAQAAKAEVERDNLIGVVNNVVKGFHVADLPEIRSHYEVLEALLSKHATRSIASASRAAETERLLQLEADINANPAAQSAFAAFGLAPVVTRLFSASREYEDLFSEFIAAKSAEERIDVALLRKLCTKALTQFFDALEYSAYYNESLDYSPLINELTRLNQYYNQQLKARDTRRKNGKKTDEEPSISPMPEEVAK